MSEGQVEELKEGLDNIVSNKVSHPMKNYILNILSNDFLQSYETIYSLVVLVFV